MKAILEFDLPEDESDFHITSRAMNWALVAWDMDQFLRDKLKYGHDYKTVDEALEKVRDELYVILDDHEVTLDDIN